VGVVDGGFVGVCGLGILMNGNLWLWGWQWWICRFKCVVDGGFCGVWRLGWAKQVTVDHLVVGERVRNEIAAPNPLSCHQ